MPLKDLPTHSRRWQWPPLVWIAAVVPLQLGLAYFGFFHWLLMAGLLFGVYWARPRREWPAWILVFTVTTLVYGAIISRQSHGEAVAFLRDYGVAQIVIGNLLFPPLCLAGPWWLHRRGIGVAEVGSLKSMAELHIAALLTALLLTARDLAYIFNEGMIGDVVRGRIVGMQPLVWPDSLPQVAQFALNHLMGAFLGIMLVVPMALWLLVPDNRRDSRRIIRSALLLPSPFVLALVLLIYLGGNAGSGISALLPILLLAAVVVFSFQHGWRGAALSVLMVSFLIAFGDHLRGGGANPIELQLYVAVMGAMALLFGASVDELRHKERLLVIDKNRLQAALAALAESSRRSLHTEELERKRLARELHDEMGQTLTAMQTELSLADADTGASLRHMQQLTARLGRSLRSVVNALTPDELDQLGLYTAITYGSPAQMCEQAGIGYQVELYGDSQLLAQLDMLTNLAAYRIVQESVNNAIKHAHCDSIRVRMRIGRRDRRILLLLEIRDDGIGLTSLRQIAHGFNSIRDRAMALDGVLSIQNIPGVRVHVLLRQNSIELG